MRKLDDRKIAMIVWLAMLMLFVLFVFFFMSD